MIPLLIALGILMALGFRRGRGLAVAGLGLVACVGWALIVGGAAALPLAAANLVVGFLAALPLQALARRLVAGSDRQHRTRPA